MTLLMPRYDNRAVVLVPDDISPELVLVDERLAELVRARLHPPSDTLARLESIASRNPIELDTRGLDAGRPAEPETLVDRPRGARALLVRGRVAAVAVVMALGILALHPPSTSEHGSTSSTTAVQSVRAPSVGHAPARPSKADAAGPGAPTRHEKPAATSRVARERPQSSEHFAWAPVEGATGYHVELFSGSSLVFETETRSAHMVVPRSWKYRGKRHRLSAGEYRWLVWAKDGRLRRSQAVVQALLVVSAR
jgi:hypothetical protein